MKKMSVILMFFICVFGFTGCSSTTSTSDDDTDGGDSDGGSPGSGVSGGSFSQTTLTVNGESRTVAFYVPNSAGSSPPLVIAFHGTSGSPADWIDSASADPSGLETLADENGFVVAAPQARAFEEGDWDHEGFGDIYWETAAPNGSDPDLNADLMLVRSIISSARTTYSINTDRVYLLGFSNGGFFAILAAMALPNEIAAFAEAGSGLVTCATTRSCTATSSSTTCSTILSANPSCDCGESEKPITVPTSGRLVPGFLAHNNGDDTVSVYYTCNLEERMDTLGYSNDVLIGDADGHAYPEGFLSQAWTFISTVILP